MIDATTLADLRRQYPRIAPHELIVRWENAHRQWPPMHRVLPEPPQVICARTLYLIAELEAASDPEHAAELRYAGHLLVRPFLID